MEGLTDIDDEALLAAQRDLERENLFSFVWTAFSILQPGETFHPAPYMQAMCHAAEKAVDGTTNRQIITVPPRHGKSICISVCLPAWLLGRDPTTKIMVASYGGNLAAKHARDFRAVIGSPWYRRLFPRTRLAHGGDRNDEQVTTEGGMRKAVSLGGAITGFGADVIIIDDLMKASDASSVVELQRGKDFYEQSLLSRLNNKARGTIIVIQQRLHEDDLPGYLLERGQFEHLNLPAVAQRDEEIPIGFGKMMRRRRGEPLCAERESLEVLRRLEVEMGAAAYSAQYLQDPTPEGGNRIRLEWFDRYAEVRPRHDYQSICQSWDTGMTAEPTSDFSVGTTWGFFEKKWHLLDVERARLDFPDLKRRVKGLADRWKADSVLIEKAGSGISLLQQLWADSYRSDRYIPCTPKEDKERRVEAQTARLDEKRYLLPEAAPWLAELERELKGFPKAKHDDQVDSLIQFVKWSSSPRWSEPTERDPVTGRPKRIVRPQSRFRG